MSHKVYFECFKEYMADAGRRGSTIGARATIIESYLIISAHGDLENPAMVKYNQVILKAKESSFSLF